MLAVNVGRLVAEEVGLAMEVEGVVVALGGVFFKDEGFGVDAETEAGLETEVGAAELDLVELVRRGR